MSDDSQVRANICTACGADNRSGARFCKQCGGKLDGEAAPSPPAAVAAEPVPTAEVAPKPAPPPKAEPVAEPAVVAATASPPGSLLDRYAHLRRPRILIPAGVAAAVVIALVGFFAFGPLAYLLTPTVKAYASRDLDVTSTTNQMSVLLGHLQRGDTISGKWVKGPGGQGRWLKVNWPVQGAGYIWGPALSPRARPDITPATPDTHVATSASVVYAEPDSQSAVTDDLSRGEAASVNGVTGSGWAELTLNAGNVGYVKATAFSPAATDANVDAPPQQIAALSGITHYVCSFSPDQSKDAPANTEPLSFYLDEGRTCLDHRYAYVADDAGGLKRVMLSDKDRRASLLYFMPDRKSFYRTDFTLEPDEYAKLQRRSAALENEICSPPADPTAAAALHKVLAKATPVLDVQAPGAVWQRKVWQCTAEK